MATPRPDLRITALGVRSSRRDALGARMRERFGLDLPDGPCRAVAGPLALLGLGPRTIWAVHDGGASLAEELGEAVGSMAAVADQSDGYPVLTIAGPMARATFEKGLSIDLHPAAFGPNAVASTLCGGVAIVLWQVEDAFVVAVPRSYAAAFWHWLQASAAEFGLSVGQA